jgi:hypothetical protein
MHRQSHSGLTHAGKPAWEVQFQPHFASSCQAGNASPISLQGHQLKWSLGPFDLWKQVQKTELSVDFTNDGA